MGDYNKDFCDQVKALVSPSDYCEHYGIQRGPGGNIRSPWHPPDNNPSLDVKPDVFMDYAAFTCGSSGDWNPAISSFLSGAVLTILQDNDEQGQHLTEQIKRDLQGVVKSIRVIIPDTRKPGADISDYFQDHSKADFEKLVSEKQTETVQEPERAAVDGQTEDINSLVQKLIKMDAYHNYGMPVP